MIRGLGRTSAGRLGLIIGLTPIDLFHLTMGAPVLIHNEDLELPMDVTIISGDTEQEITESLRRYGMIDDNTITGISPQEEPGDGQS